MAEEQVEFKITDRRGQAKEAPKEVTSSVTMKNPAPTKKVATSPMFSNLLMSLSTSTLMYLGAIPNPATGEIELDLDAAKQQIELLAMLKEKTEGNRSDEENRLLDDALYNLHLRFVELTKKPPQRG